MSNFAFDLDGTISSNPEIFGTLMKALVDAKHHVVVLTGALDPLEIPANVENREQQLLKMGIRKSVNYHELVIVVQPDVYRIAQEKGKYCFKHKIDMIIEDREQYLYTIAVESPSTARLKVHGG
jgi:hypothetical protein